MDQIPGLVDPGQALRPGGVHPYVHESVCEELAQLKETALHAAGDGQLQDGVEHLGVKREPLEEPD